MIVSVALMSFHLGSLCWLTFSEESTDCGENKLLSKAQLLGPLIEGTEINTSSRCCIKATNTLNQSKVGHCASWSSELALSLCCGIRLTLQEARTAS